VAERLFVHVGMPKSGTTYLQSLLWTNRDKLAEVGVLVPGDQRFDHNRITHAVRTHHQDARAERTWAQISREIADWPGTAVISNEWLCQARQAQAQRTVEAFHPAEVHVIATARDLLRTVPSAWQETIKLGVATSFSEFVGSLARQESRWRWSNLDPSLCLPRWQASLPRGQVHLVTVPSVRGRPHLLWERFAGLIGAKDNDFDLDTGTPNESIGAESARLLRTAGPRLREALGVEDLAWNEPYRWIRHLVAHEVLAPLGGSPIGMRAEEVDVLRERSAASVRRLAAGGYDVVGDLDELTGSAVASGAVRPDDVSDAAALEVSVEVIAELLVRLRRATGQAESAARTVAQLRAALPAVGPADGSPGGALGRLAGSARRLASKARKRG
jgi:hypothetical protein